MKQIMETRGGGQAGQLRPQYELADTSTLKRITTTVSFTVYFFHAKTTNCFFYFVILVIIL